MFGVIVLSLTAFASNYAVPADNAAYALASQSPNLPVRKKDQSYRIHWHRYDMFFLTQRSAEERAEGRRVFGAKSQLSPTQLETISSESICPAQLGTAIEAVINRPQFRPARWGILIEPLLPKTRNRALYNLNADRYFIPASNTKLLTTAAALLALGSDYRIRTSIYDAGGGKLQLVGRGDPSLTETQLLDLAQQLKRQGVRNIRELIVEDGYFRGDAVHPTWEWEDVQANYGASVNSLILNQNAVELTLSPQQPGQPLRLSWSDAIAYRQWRIENESVTAEAGTPNSVNVTAVLGQPILRIKGQLPADAKPEPFGIAILDPAKYFLQHFRLALAWKGIKVEKASVVSDTKLNSPGAYTLFSPIPSSARHGWHGCTDRISDKLHPSIRVKNPCCASPSQLIPPSARHGWHGCTDRVSDKLHACIRVKNPCCASPSSVLVSENSDRELAAVESPPLSALVFETNQESNNLYAEVLLRTLQVSAQKSFSISPNDNSAEIGLKQLKATLTALGVDPESYVLVDGSGLSRHNLVSPDAIAQTLQLMAQTPQAKVYQASLPIAGVSGTLKNRLQNTAAQGHVYAKTGGMTGVSALSGYLDVPGYQPLVFSIMVNQSDQSFATLRQAIDEIVLLLTRLRSC